jgi:hypothetical protein
VVTPWEDDEVAAAIWSGLRSCLVGELGEPMVCTRNPSLLGSPGGARERRSSLHE